MASPQTIKIGAAGQLSGTGGVVKAGNGSLIRLFISSASGTPTVTIYDNISGTANPLIPTFTPVAGTSYELNVMFQNGLNIVLGGTVTGAAIYV
jgi:hypothetical protein